VSEEQQECGDAGGLLHGCCCCIGWVRSGSFMVVGGGVLDAVRDLVVC